MSEARLYLDGELVDVDSKTSIVETKQINNLFELKDRQTSFTNNFTVLLTNETSKILDRIGDTYNTSIKPYRNITPQVYRDGIPTITDGKFVIKSVEKRKKVKGSIQDGIISLFDAIGSKTIADLNFTGISHKFTIGIVLKSFQNTWENGYIYSLADFGVFDSNKVDLKYQVPSLFIKWIWEQIFIDAGFTYTYRGDNNILDSEDFKNKLISLNKGFIFENESSQPIKKVELNNIDTVDVVGRNYIRMVEVFDPENYHSLLSEQSQIYVNANNYYQIIFTGLLSGQGIIVIELNDNVFIKIDPSDNFNESVFVYLTINDKIKIYSEGSGQRTYRLLLKMYQTSGENQINFNSFLDNVKQKDFLKTILQMYGLFFQREKGTNNYEFIRVQDLFVNRKESVNYSDKFHSLDIETFNFGKYARTNNLKYSYDEEDDDFADGSFYIDNENLPESLTLLTLPFKAPVLSNNSFNNELLYQITLFDTSNDDKVKLKKTKPYISNLKKKIGSFDYILGSYSGSFNGTIAISDFDGLNFNTLIYQNYNSFIKTLNRTKVFNVNLELTANDVYKFDFLKLVYLEQFQRYFYCNKIKNFKGNKITKVELIEVNTSQQEFGEYNDDYSLDYNI